MGSVEVTMSRVLALMLVLLVTVNYVEMMDYKTNEEVDNSNVTDANCVEKFPYCQKTGGTCIPEKEGIICNCPDIATLGLDNKCTVTDKKCDEKFPQCINTGGICVPKKDGVICQCPDKATLDSDNKCIVEDTNCDETFPDCQKTGGTCVPKKEGIKCKCPDIATIHFDKKCIVKDKKCDEKFPQCINTGGACVPKKDGVICQCPDKTTLDSDNKCIVEDANCDEKFPYCQKTGGTCVSNKEGIICKCPDIATIDSDNKCIVKDKKCDEKFPKCINTGGACVPKKYGVICQCPDIATLDLDNKCIVKDKKCDEKFPQCINTGGACVPKKGGVICQCSEKATLDSDNKCIVEDANCDEKFPYCQETGGICVSKKEGITCKCPDVATLDLDNKCIVKDKKCDEKFPKCLNTGGACVSKKYGVICQCPDKTTLDSDNKCVVQDANCDEKFPYCQETGGTCVPKKEGIICKCPDIATLDLDNKCIVKDKKCDEKFPKCINTGGACVPKKDGVICQCSDKMTLDSDNKCIVKKDKCDEIFQSCTSTGGKCASTRTGIICICPSDTEFSSKDGSCIVTEKKCKDDLPLCLESGGSCGANENGIYCKCPESQVLDVSGKQCDWTPKECSKKLPKCIKTGGKCKTTRSEINCECPSEKIADPTRKHCIVTEKKCKEDLPLCLESGGSCEANENGIYCKCPEDKVSDVSGKRCLKNQCNPNPCKNGGTCQTEEETYICNCTNRYKGNDCAEANCLESETQKCNGTKCIFDELLNKASCVCENAHEFDEAKRICKEIDPCIVKTLFNECDKLHETCEKGNCTCKENYKYTDNKLECLENFCAAKGACPTNSNCEELGGGRVLCTCDDGFYEDGKACKKIDPCSPGVSECDQKCLNGKCDCYDGFVLENDEVSCRQVKDEELGCNLKCGVGKCIKKANNKFECGCPSATHTFNGTTCVDICSHKNFIAPEGMCPSNKCELDDKYVFRCKCEDPYELADDGIYCRRKLMCEEKNVFANCARKLAIRCEELLAYPGYKCVCEEGSDLENGVCTNKCQMKIHKDRCEKLRATCELDSNYEPVCKCPPLLMQQDPTKRCEIKATNTYFGKISVLKSKYEKNSGHFRHRRSTDGINLPMLKRDMINSMKATYVSADNSLLSDLKLIQCNIGDNLVSCSLELQFKKKLGNDVNIISSDSICIPIDEDFCLLKPNLIMLKLEKKNVFHETNPCGDEEVKLKLCGNSTNCNLTKDGDFECRCKKEFHTIGSYKPIPSSNSFVQKCNDINECDSTSACPPSTDCINQYGGHDCRCKDGFKKKHVNSDPKIDGCDELCNPDPCGEHGKCLKVGHHGFSCNCTEGYTGPLCNTTVPVAKPVHEESKKATIVGGVLGGVLFIIIIVAFIIYRRMKKSPNSDEEYAVNRQRGVFSEVNRLRRQEERRDDFPSKDERPRPLPRNDGGNKVRMPGGRMIPRVQATRQRSDGQEGGPSSSEETPGRSRRDETKVQGSSNHMQYRNDGYDEEE